LSWEERDNHLKGLPEEDRIVQEHLWDHELAYKDEPKHGTVLYRWGFYPFYGLLATTVLSKELFVLDHMYPNVGFFACCGLFATWMAAPLLHSGAKEDVIREEQDLKGTYDLIFALLDKRSSAIEAGNKIPGLVKQFAEEYKATAAAAAEAEVRAVQMVAYNETLSQLQALATQKAAEQTAQADVANEILEEFFSIQFTDNPELVAQTVDEAIEALGRLDPAQQTEKLDVEAALALPDDVFDEKYDNDIKFQKDVDAQLDLGIVDGLLDGFIESGHFDYCRIDATQTEQ